MAKTDPEGAAVLTHTEVRLLAIREEMERIILERKLKATAEDWATDVNSLTDIVVKSAQQYVATDLHLKHEEIAVWKK
jgi:activator of HSP90 ATPase